MVDTEESGWSLIPARGELLFVLATILGFVLTAGLHVGDLGDRFKSPPGLLDGIGELVRKVRPDQVIPPLIFNSFTFAAASLILGFLEPRHAWRWGFATAILGPAICIAWWMAYQGFGKGLTGGWSLFAIFTQAWDLTYWAVPALVAGYLGAKVRKRRDRKSERETYRPGRFQKRQYETHQQTEEGAQVPQAETIKDSSDDPQHETLELKEEQIETKSTDVIQPIVEQPVTETRKGETGPLRCSQCHKKNLVWRQYNQPRPRVFAGFGVMSLSVVILILPFFFLPTAWTHGLDTTSFLIVLGLVALSTICIAAGLAIGGYLLFRKSKVLECADCGSEYNLDA